MSRRLLTWRGNWRKRSWKQARARLASREIRTNIAVVDVGGNLESFTRMDGAWLSGIDIAIKTACTARLFDMATEELGPVVRPGQPRYDIEPSNGGLRLSRHLDDRVEAGEPATRVRAV